MTYLCAPVGPSDGTGGLLAVGSDTGFEIGELDVALVSTFASLLFLALQAKVDEG
jgi:hypothetical protein